MHPRHYTKVVAVLLLMLLVAACQSATAPTPTPEAPAEVAEQVEQQFELRDTAWTMVSVGVEEQIAAVPDSYPSLNFFVERYNGYTGCNYVLGTFYVDGDSLTINWPSSTGGPCESDELTDQEMNFLSAITAVDGYSIDGEQLQLSVSGQQVMTLDPLEPVPFEGTVWSLKFFQSSAVEPDPVIPDTVITAQFEGETVSGNAGCNDYTGTVVRDAKKITISDVVASDNVCEEPEYIMDQEQRYLEQLQNAALVDEHPRSMEFRDGDAIPLMLFHTD